MVEGVFSEGEGLVIGCTGYKPQPVIRENDDAVGPSLSHGIIERHGGRISVSSRPGDGTTFLIELPLEARSDDDQA